MAMCVLCGIMVLQSPVFAAIADATSCPTHSFSSMMARKTALQIAWILFPRKRVSCLPT